MEVAQTKETFRCPPVFTGEANLVYQKLPAFVPQLPGLAVLPNKAPASLNYRHRPVAGVHITKLLRLLGCGYDVVSR